MAARMLVIEDNPANLDLIAYLLGVHGYTVLTAVDGTAGLAAARQQRPDLIVCDVQLPGLSGFEVARHLKDDPALGAIPLVAVTAFAMVGDRDRVLAAGFDGYIAKPIDPETFVPRVAIYLRPDQRGAAAAPQLPAAPAPRRPAGRHLILVVDNLPVQLELARSILEPSGYEVRTAPGMRPALELARQEPPDLILSDVQMSEGTGYDFIQAVKGDPALRAVPFIFLTATMCTERDRARGLALGAARFLFRPIEPVTLLAEIAACLPAAKG